MSDRGRDVRVAGRAGAAGRAFTESTRPRAAAGAPDPPGGAEGSADPGLAALRALHEIQQHTAITVLVPDLAAVTVSPAQEWDNVARILRGYYKGSPATSVFPRPTRTPASHSCREKRLLGPVEPIGQLRPPDRALRQVVEVAMGFDQFPQASER